MAINLFQSTPNNIFQQQHNAFQNNNYTPQQQISQSQQAIGSYRGQFKQIRINNDQNDNLELQSTNCYSQIEYKGISPIQVRLEDYYLIRSQQITQTHRTQVEAANRKGNFNSKLLTSANIQNLKPPKFVHSNDFFSTQNNLFNQNNNKPGQSSDLFRQSNTNLFQNNQSTNIFGQNNSTMASSNLFNTTATSNNNIFQQNNTSSNIFSQNLFGNNQNTNIFNQQYPNNNIFTSQNIFQNSQPVYNNVIPIQNYAIPPSFDNPQFIQLGQLPQLINLAQQQSQEFAFYEQQQQQNSDQFDQMLRESTNRNIQYIPPFAKKSQKSSCPSKPLNFSGQSTTLNTKSLANKNINQDYKKISSFEERAPTYHGLQIEIEFLESEQTLTLLQEFPSRSRVLQIKQFVENHLTNIEVFGRERYQYFDNCSIQNESGQQLDLTQPIIKHHKLYFKYYAYKLPKLIRNDYFSNLSEYADYSCVNNFTIWNEYGSVTWPSETNLLYVDLDKIIEINNEQIEVYDTKKIHTLLKPEVGNKLNKECYITFKFNINQNFNPQKFELNIKRQSQKQGLEFIQVDFETQTFTVKAYHFSGYRFNSDFSSTDDSGFRAPQNYAEAQTQDVEQEDEESEYESESLSIQIKDESNLLKKKQFDQVYTLTKTKEKQINEQLVNQAIQRVNTKFNKQIPLQIQQQQDQQKLNLEILEQYFDSYLQFNFKKNSLQTTALLLNTLYNSKNPNDEIIKTFKMLNILFGSPSLDMVQFLQLLVVEQVKFEDIDLQLKQSKLRGFALSLFLEQFKMNYEANEFRQEIIQQQQSGNFLNNVLLTLNNKQKNNPIAQINQNDWIDDFVNWRINKSQPQPLYENSWWNSLYTEMKSVYSNTPQFAAILYFLLKKTKQPQTEWKKLFDFLTKNSDSFTIILFDIIAQRCKVKSQSLKIIGKTMIEKLIAKRVSQELMNNFLASLENKIFEKKEIETIKSHISKHIYYYSQTMITGQKIHFYLNSQNFLKAIEIILIEKKINEYEQIMKNILIPYLILYTDRFKEDKYAITLIQQVIQQFQNNEISKICMMYLDQQYFDKNILRNWIVSNDYQYHMKQLIVRMFNDEF